MTLPLGEMTLPLIVVGEMMLPPHPPTGSAEAMEFRSRWGGMLPGATLPACLVHGSFPVESPPPVCPGLGYHARSRVS